MLRFCAVVAMVGSLACGGASADERELDACGVGREPIVSAEGLSKVGPPLEEQMEAAGSSGRVQVLVALYDDLPFECARDEILAGGGNIQSIERAFRWYYVVADVPVSLVHPLAGRADVRSIDAEFEDTPPP